MTAVAEGMMESARTTAPPADAGRGERRLESLVGTSPDIRGTGIVAGTAGSGERGPVEGPRPPPKWRPSPTPSSKPLRLPSEIPRHRPSTPVERNESGK